MRFTIAGLVAVLALSGAFLGCGGSDDDDGDCIDVSGDWTLTAHCDPSMVGNDVTITQNGCKISVEWAPGMSWNGTVSGSTLTVSGDRGDGTILTCGGTVTGDTWNSTCSPDPCDVTVTRK